MIDDDTLILYYYGDGLDDDERAHVETSLRSDPPLALRYAELSAVLAQLQLATDITPPTAAVHRWQSGLARAARLEASDRPRSWLSGWLVRTGAAIAALALLAIAIDSQRRVEPIVAFTTPMLSSDPAPTTTENPLTRGVRTHLRQTRLLVDTLASTDAGNRHAALAEAIQRNRNYERSADNQDDERLARLLRAFEMPLMRLADRQTSDIALDDERERLAFELDIVRTRLANPPHHHL